MVTAMKVVLTPSLAPYRVVLLALIAAYSAGILPRETQRPLLTTIIKYIEGPGSETPKNYKADDLDDVPTLDGILGDITSACIKADPKSGERNARDIEMRALHAIWTLTSLDSLHAFITNSRSLLVKNMAEGKALLQHMTASSVPTYLLTSTSFLGKFVLQCVELFESLEYNKAELLWVAFVNFRDAGKVKWSKKGDHPLTEFQDLFKSPKVDDDPSVLKTLVEQLRNPQREDSKQLNMVSQEDLTALVYHQVHMLEYYGSDTPPKLKRIFDSMAQSEAGKIPQIHYIRYLQCVREQDYDGAFKWLHRYFDYRISTRDQSFYHYALLCLASLHAHFNCDQEAIRAIEEAIAVAREKKDMDCLSFLLNWLFNFMRDRPHLQQNFYFSNKQLLQYLKSNTGSGKSTSLHSRAYQADAALMMMEGGPLSTMLESMTKALSLALSSTESSKSLFSYCQLASVFWFRQRNQSLSDVYIEIAKDISAGPRDDVTSTIAISHRKFLQGNIETAFSMLDEQRTLCVGHRELTKELTTHMLILLAEHSIRLCHYNTAARHISKLLSQDHTAIDIKGTIYCLEIELQLQLGNIDGAFRLTNERLKYFARPGSNTCWFLEISIFKSKIMTLSSSPARALSSSLQCLKTSISYGYLYHVMKAVLQLAFVLVKLGQFNDSRDLLLEALPRLEYAVDIRLKSQLYKLLAECLVELHPSEEDEMQSITKVVQSLELAVDGFKKMSDLVQVKECLELEQRFGNLIQHQDITNHAVGSLVIINARIDQEIRSPDN